MKKKEIKFSTRMAAEDRATIKELSSASYNLNLTVSLHFRHRLGYIPTAYKVV